MDGISSSMLSGMGAYPSAPSMLPSQPSQPIVIPPSVSNTTARPGDNAPQPQSSNTTANSSQTVNRNETPQPSSSAQVSVEQQRQEQQVQQVIAQLKSRDQEVRTHEQAHLSAAGQYATGGIKYQYQTGPDGQKYAVGGSVGIDTSPVAGDPEATLQKAMVVQRAALAPAQPSGQDMRVAAQASQMMMQAQSEIRMQQFEESDMETTEQQADSTEASAESGSAQRINPDRNDFEVRLSLQQTQATNDPYMIQSAS